MRLRQGRRHVRVLVSDPYADRSGLYAPDIENAKKTLSKKRDRVDASPRRTGLGIFALSMASASRDEGLDMVDL